MNTLLSLIPSIGALPTEDAAGYLIIAVLVVGLVVALIVYVILPLTLLIAAAGVCYGGYFAISNYFQAFNEVTVKGNRR